MHRFVVWTVVSDLPTSRTSGLRNRLEGVFCLLSRAEGVIQFTVRRDEMEM